MQATEFNLGSGKPRVTHVVLLLDKSGSMGDIHAQTIDSVNEYIGSLRQRIAGETVIYTERQFDDSAIEKRCTAMPIAEVTRLDANNYVPRGGTPLLDALARTMLEIDGTMDAADGRLFVAVSDGQENSSREYKKQAIRNMIEARQGRGWTFVFLGCDFDVYGEGGSMGYATANTMKFDKPNIRHAMYSNSGATARYRGTIAAGATAESLSGKGFYSAEDKLRGEAKKEPGS